MNSKEALKNIKTLSYCKQHITIQEWCNIIEQDLDKLEMLKKENKVLREKVNHFKNVKNRHKRNQKFVENENTELKKAIEILKDKFKYELGVSVVNEKYHYSLEFLFNYSYISITKEQYDLLKEVFGNAKD